MLRNRLQYLGATELEIPSTCKRTASNCTPSPRLLLPIINEVCGSINAADEEKKRIGKFGSDYFEFGIVIKFNGYCECKKISSCAARKRSKEIIMVIVIYMQFK